MNRAVLTSGLLLLVAQLGRAQNIEVDARRERKSATVDEAWMRGLGDLRWHTGRNFELISRAYGNVQEADKQRLENLIRYDEATRGTRKLTLLARHERVLRKSSAHRLPQKLLSPEGIIQWPPTLLAPEFEPQRQRIDELFRSRAISSYPEHGRFYSDVQNACGILFAILQNKVLELSTPSYMEGARFLRNLAHEASFVAP